MGLVVHMQACCRFVFVLFFYEKRMKKSHSLGGQVELFLFKGLMDVADINLTFAPDAFRYLLKLLM